MNIFYIDRDPDLAAQYHYNSHVVKMILESAQLLSTCHHILDGFKENIYRPAHTNHPCTLWSRTSRYNYEWLYRLYISLCKEYTFRFKKIHKSESLKNFLSIPPQNIPLFEFTMPYQAMPDEYRHPDSLVAYRNYYKIGKKHLSKYTKRDMPSWLISTND